MGHTEPQVHAAPTAVTGSKAEFWMPFTSNRDFKADPKMVVRAEGMYYYTESGRKIIDASSGLFCVNAGHARKEITEAVAKQLAELDFVPPFMRGHPKSFALAERVAQLTPGDLKRIFFVNSGSEAIDTAMKIALAYHQARGQAGRTMFVSRERAYHGVNFGGVALSGIVNNRRKFGPGLHVAHMRHTHVKENYFVRGQGEHGADLADDLLRFVNLYGAENIAACFVEPIAGSSGCLVPPKGYLDRLRAICSEHGILLVFDEVITGFGRLGQPFGAQRFGVTPDMICFAKIVTNGVVPMGGVIVKPAIYEAFMTGPDTAVELFHGYTYSGHPVAAAAAHATLDALEAEDAFGRARELEPVLERGMHSLKGEPGIADIRNIGLAAAVELDPFPGRPGARALKVFERGIEEGMLFRFTGETVAVAPPYISTKAEIEAMVEKLRVSIRAAA